jgi:hypothetical protein
MGIDQHEQAGRDGGQYSHTAPSRTQTTRHQKNELITGLETTQQGRELPGRYSDRKNHEVPVLVTEHSNFHCFTCFNRSALSPFHSDGPARLGRSRNRRDPSPSFMRRRNMTSYP